MSKIDPTGDPHDWFAYSEWVRHLARRLLEDEAAADDVAQEALLVTLRQPVGRVTDLRGWLAGVVRKLSLRSLRTRAARREIRESVPVFPLVPSSEEVLERETLRRSVVEAVLSLDEPYRSTLLLHFYEGLSPGEIARRHKLPRSTVRTHLQRGLQRLREKLEAQDPDRRHSLHAGLVWLARGEKNNAPQLPSSETAMLVGSQSKLAAGVLLITGLVTVLWLTFLAPDRSANAVIADRTSDGEALGKKGRGTGPDDMRFTAQATREAESSTRNAPTVAWRLAIVRPQGALWGTLIRIGDNAPLPGASVRIVASTGAIAHGAPLLDDRGPLEFETTADTSGHFSFESIPTGPYHLFATAEGGLEAEQIATATQDGTGLIVALASSDERGDRVTSLLARVLDGGKQPLAGVEVRMLYRDFQGQEFERAVRSNDAGLARFDALDLRTGLLLVEGDNHGVGHAFLEPEAVGGSYHTWRRSPKDVRGPAPVYDLVLETSGTLVGTVTGGNGSSVYAWLRSQASFGRTLRYERSAVCDQIGNFRIDSLPPGRYLLSVDAPPGTRAALPHWVYGGRQTLPELFPLIVEIKPGGECSVAIPLVAGPTVRGQVIETESGAPVGEALVRAWIVRKNNPDPGGTKRGEFYAWHLSSHTSFDEWAPSTCMETKTDAKGNYVLAGLNPSEVWVLEVLAPGLSRDFVDPLELADGQTLNLQHRLGRAGGVQGVAWRTTIALRREGELQFADAVNMPSQQGSSFTITGLRPGPYEVFAVHWNDRSRTIPLCKIEVRAGELAWLDLRDAAPLRSEGRVLYRGTPLARAIVSLQGPDQFIDTVTNEEGRFVLHYAFATNDPAVFDVIAPGLQHSVPSRFVVPGMIEGNANWNRDLELPDAELIVTVRDAQGRALEAAVLLTPRKRALQDSITNWGRLPNPSDVQVSMRAVRHQTDTQGRAWFTALAAGQYELSTELPLGWSLPPATVTVDAGRRVGVELVAPEAGVVTVRVLDAQGRPVRGARIQLNRRLNGEGEFALAKPRFSDEHGEVRFPEVASGAVRVLAEIDPTDPIGTKWVEERAEIPPGASVAVQLQAP